MIHLSVAVGEFFRILLTTMFGTALRLILVTALAVVAICGLALTLRAIVRALRK